MEVREVSTVDSPQSSVPMCMQHAGFALSLGLGFRGLAYQDAQTVDFLALTMDPGLVDCCCTRQSGTDG